MTNIDQKYEASLYEFRAIIECKKHSIDEKDFVSFQNRLLKDTGSSKSLDNKRADEIRLKSSFIGRNGWAISPYWKPLSNETWYDTWFTMAYNNEAENISHYFVKDNYLLLKTINGYSRFMVGRADWFIEAERVFDKRCYTSCAMLLTAILEEGVRRAPIREWSVAVIPFFDKHIQFNIEDYYNKNLEPLNKYIDTILLLPSLNEFIKNYFNSIRRFDKDQNGIEMKEGYILNRNWLMHGMTNRKINETECIKLFNAIASLHYLLQTLFC